MGGHRRQRVWPALVWLLTSASYTQNSAALETRFGAALSFEHTDNIDFAPTDQRAELVVTPRLAVSVNEDSPNFALAAAAAVEYLNYTKNTYENDHLTYLSARSAWKPRPQRLEWRFDDFASPATTDPFAPPTPSNRQNTNIFTTGPDLFLPLTPVDTLVAGYRWGDFYYEVTNIDSNRHLLVLRWLHKVSNITQLSLNGSAGRVDFKDPERTGDDYDRYDAFARAEQRLGRSRLVADAGASDITKKKSDVQESRSFSGFLGKLDWEYQIGPDRTLNFYASAGYSDAGRDVLTLFEAGDARPGSLEMLFAPNLTTGDLFYGKRAGVSFRQARAFVLDAIRSDEDYEEAQVSRLVTSGRAELNYAMSATLSVNLLGDYTETEQKDREQIDKDRTLAAGLLYRSQRWLAVALSAGYRDRRSTNPASEYQERRLLLSIAVGEDLARHGGGGY